LEGRAHGGSGGGRVRVAAWEAMGPRQFPLPRSLLTPPWRLRSAPVKRLADWEDSLVGLEASVVPPPRWHLDTSAVSPTMVAGGVGVSLGGHATSTTPPPHPTPVAPRYANEERPAAVSS
jgi:hypothetical protein